MRSRVQGFLDSSFKTSSGVTFTSLCMNNRARPFSLVSDIVFLRYVLRYLREENDLSAVHIVTGNVPKICKSLKTEGKEVFVQRFKTSSASTGCPAYGKSGETGN